MQTAHGQITIDDTRFPVIDVAYHQMAGGPRLDDYAEAFAEYERIARRGKPMVYLVDMRDFDPLRIDAGTRRGAAKIFQEKAERLRRVSVAEARVITSPLTRGIVTAFDWLTNANKWPCQQFATLESAEEWLRVHLARAPSP